MKINSIGLFALFVILLSVFSSCDISRNIELSKGELNMPDEIADSLEVVTVMGEKIDSKLWAVHLERFYDRKITIMESVYTETYETDGRLKYSLKCNKAEIDETKNILTATGNVIITSESGVLKTEKLIWDQNTDELFTDVQFTLIRGDNLLKGEYLRTDMNFEKIDMQKVKGEGLLNAEEIEW
ncbi:MAG: LPS export ABC transporter periplasmic protein LptC [Candidatus Cloacimonetes bacterium]|nr:LPS export ABC transporter periplasmic protein LptC [Candidatus Cloacimonadota bacterium]